MKIAIDASPAFAHLRTGIEEYTYQLIKHLRPHLKDYDVTLFIRGGTRENIDFPLPRKWIVKELSSPKYWTYFRLSLAMLFGRYDRLFVPGHIVPPIHPRHTTMVVHGLEYEMTPQAFSAKERRSMRFGIKKSCSWARYIICVSNNTKKDLINLYDVNRDKIRVVYEGVNFPQIDAEDPIYEEILEELGIVSGQYLFFVGRIERRKNIMGILKAYEILREHFRVTHKLVLSGKEGFGWEEIAAEIAVHPFREDIITTGFVSEDEKWALHRNASVFVFPTFYEGFGLPILEAQHAGVPVVTSNISSLPEISGDSTLLAQPEESTDIAEQINRLLTDDGLRADIVAKGYVNIQRFDWKKAARLSTKVILAGEK